MTRSALFCCLALVTTACGKTEDLAQAPAVTPTAAEPTPVHAEFDALGTEPFWSVKIRGDSLTLSRLDHANVTVPAPRVEVLGETLEWRVQEMSVSITPGECSDGMSDRAYKYKAEVRTGREVLKGCASKADETPSAEPAS